MKPQLLSLLVLLGPASAAVHTVTVGVGGLVYNPSSLEAAVGDTVVFQFSSQNHAVVEGIFSSPCQPLAGGWFTPPEEAPSTFTVVVESTEPQVYYCSVDSHCQNGMVGVINPSGDISQSAYAAAAANVANNVAPSGTFGGFPTSSSVAIVATTSTPVATVVTSASVATIATSAPVATSATVAIAGTVTSAGASTKATAVTTGNSTAVSTQPAGTSVAPVISTAPASRAAVAAGSFVAAVVLGLGLIGL